jgi:hypothetical protein
MYKPSKSFYFGALSGLILFMFIVFGPGVTPTPGQEKILSIIGIPFKIINPVDNALHWVCDVFRSNTCRGTGFDGGPLVWIEWTSVAIVMAFWYGIIFLLGEKIVTVLKKLLNK